MPKNQNLVPRDLFFCGQFFFRTTSRSRSHLCFAAASFHAHADPSLSQPAATTPSRPRPPPSQPPATG